MAYIVQPSQRHATDLMLATESCIDIPKAGLNRFMQYPAIKALLIQFVACLLTLVFGVALSVFSGVRVNWLTLLAAQALISAAITWYLDLAIWWVVMQFLFAPALMALNALQLPPGLFLAIFVVMVGLYWSTFRTQVPLYPSGPSTWNAVEQLLPAQGPFRLVDIGSGLGGFVLHLARQRPDSRITGIELAPLTWLASAMRARFQRSTVQMLRGGYEQLNLADFDVVFAYLSPAAMPALWAQARAEMRPGALLLSFEFSIAGIQPDFHITPKNNSGKKLYCWTM